MSVSTGRRYRSALRDERARDTRRRIRTSAIELFASHGFAAATIAQIASHAGVSTQTVYSVFGSKAGIVGDMLDHMEEAAGHEEAIAELVAESDPHRQLRLLVSMQRRMFETGAPVLRAAMAAQSDPDVAAMAERGNANRRAGTTTLTQMWADRQVLRAGLDPADAGERLWLLTGPEQFLLAVDGLGWSPDRYEAWLSDLLDRELLAGHP